MKTPAALGAFGAAVAAYALFSSPTPDVPSWPEAAIVILLLAAVVLGGDIRTTLRARWVPAYLPLLGYAAVVPTLTAVIFAGADGGDIARDLVAFTAFFLPVLLAGLFTASQNRNVLLAALIGTGLVFSVRYLLAGDVLAGAFDNSAFLYLANSPAVPFAAAWLLLQGCFCEKRWLHAIAMIVFSLIPVIAMAGMMQRATLTLLALVWVGFWVAAWRRTPRRALAVTLLAAMVLAFAWPVLAGVGAALWEKTRMVGANARAGELAALYDAAAQNPWTLAFGTGWGSLFKSPAVGDHWVRFSHGLFTSLLWKTGWAGLLLGGVALAALLRDAARRLRHDMVTFYALLLPLLPAMVLYGSYKSFCFGLLLLGLAALDWTAPVRNGNETPQK